jgi:hypothetical protein
MTAVISNTIWIEGNAAQSSGQPSSTNPYPAGSQESADWLEGYTTAEAEQITAGSDASQSL